MDLGEFKETINTYSSELDVRLARRRHSGRPLLVPNSSKYSAHRLRRRYRKPRQSKPGVPTTSSNDIVGSAISPFRGTLVGKASAAGNLTVAYRGKGITSLLPGGYRITVVDRSSTSGFNLQKVRHSLRA